MFSKNPFYTCTLAAVEHQPLVVTGGRGWSLHKLPAQPQYTNLLDLSLEGAFQILSSSGTGSKILISLETMAGIYMNFRTQLGATPNVPNLVHNLYTKLGFVGRSLA